MLSLRREIKVGIIVYKFILLGCRNVFVLNYKEVIIKIEFEKLLVFIEKKWVGRNNQGRIIVCYRGGGYKKKIRIVDFKRDKDGIFVKVEVIEYDLNRIVFLVFLCYVDGERRYIIVLEGLKVGDIVMFGLDVDIKVGNVLLFKNIFVGIMIYNIEFMLGKGGQFCCLVGSVVQFMVKEGKYVLIKFLFGEFRYVS